jgi:YYY domain-containing protein
MISILFWYLAISLIGWAVFPLTYRIFGGLKDHGFAFSRILGLLLWGFCFFILGSFRIAQNDLGGVLLAFVPVAGLVLWTCRKGKFVEVTSWIKHHLKYVVTAEMVFLVMFLAWAFIRSANPEISGTEKPMELAFINGILRSPGIPPNDPWLSGYSISYYYFGYLIVAMLIRVTGTISGVAFNLAISHTFALAALGAYGLVYNLLNSRLLHKDNEIEEQREKEPERAGLFSSLLGPLFLLLVSNFEGVLEFLYAGGVFWKTNANGTLSSSFWSWLDILELNVPPAPPFNWWPSRPSGVLYWRASRVVQDYDLVHGSREIIDEFPFFSYLLADLHPHVLSIPFVLLGIALALNLFLGGAKGENPFWGFNLEMDRFTWIISCIVLGGLAFLNTWDFPIGVGLFAGAYVFARAREHGWHWQAIGHFLLMGIATGLVSILFYLPFYAGFSSQAGGFIPSVIYSTRGIYFWVMFGPLLIPILGLLLLVGIRKGNLDAAGRGFGAGAALIGILWVISFLAGLIGVNLPTWGAQLSTSNQYFWARLGVKLTDVGNLFLSSQGANAQDSGYLILTALGKRFAEPGTWLTLLVLLGLSIGGLIYFNRRKDAAEEPVRPSIDLPDGIVFVFLMIVLGGCLTIFPEFFYLRDQFGWRMNTIFKFYYQAWILWSIAAAFAVIILFRSMRGVGGALARVGLSLVILAGLAYPVIMLDYKTNHFKPGDGYTLDGNAYLSRYSSDLGGIEWLKTAPVGPVAEAVGGSYSQYARISTLTGQPSVLGWTPHESQWRGGGTEMGTRMQDIETLYTSKEWATALSIISQYDIRYVVVGALEMSTYQVSTDKFNQYCGTAYQDQGITIYECQPVVSTAGTAR